MTPTILLIGAVVLGALMIGSLVLVFVGSNDRSRQRLATLEAKGATSGEATVTATGARVDNAPTLTRALENSEWGQALQVGLIRAGWMLRPSEFVALCLLVGAGAAALVMLISHSLIEGIIIGLVGLVAPHFALKSRQQKRIKDLSAQLPDGLDMLAGSLRSGFSVLRAMQVVRSQMHPPIAEEFGRVVDEVQYGIPLEVALDNLVERSGSYDLELIVAAVQTQLAVGGNLAEIFDSIAEMIRERVRLLGELQAATAEGRLSAGILLAMPFVMALAVNVMSPGYLAPLFHTQMGLILVGVALVMMGLGAIILRKLIEIDV
jgi:tight adherence protein B